jgi:hypothetical protein
MKIQIPLKILIALVILVSQHLLAQGNLVINGGFDNISDTNVIGWTLTGHCYPDPKYGNYAPCLQLYGTAGAGQTVNGLTPGTTYIVSERV